VTSAPPARALRVVLTSNTLHVGGAERQRVLLANGLAARGHSVTVVTLQEAGPLAAQLGPDVALVQSRALGGRFPGPAGSVITGCTNTEAAFAWTARLRSRGSLRWLAVSHSWPGTGALYPRPLRVLLRRADAVGALTSAHADAIRRSEGLKRSPLVLPNGVELTAGTRPEPTPGGPTRLGYVGRLERVKGLDRLLRALSHVPADRWTLDVYGDGSERAALESLARELELSVRWHGFVADVPRALAALDLLVIPSRSEALPMVALEALAAGVLVAAAPVGALPEVLADGGVCLAADEEHWPEQLRRLLEDPAGRIRLARSAAEAVRSRWSVDAMVERYESALLSLR
jgi:glycosyltransferase involved in cell wall biosynthesis